MFIHSTYHTGMPGVSLIINIYCRYIFKQWINKIMRMHKKRIRCGSRYVDKCSIYGKLFDCSLSRFSEREMQFILGNNMTKWAFQMITNEHQRLQRSEATNWSTVFMLFITEEDIGCLNVYVSSCCIINVKILYKWQKILNTL